ncbi:MAG: hypothetical protein OK438_02260 [Thaumarchaeota archaeon]|nr:hypothetical protein [Nitrososphaerota archaeon]
MEPTAIGMLTDLEDAIETLADEVKKLQRKIDRQTEEIERLKRKP